MTTLTLTETDTLISDDDIISAVINDQPGLMMRVSEDILTALIMGTSIEQYNAVAAMFNEVRRPVDGNGESWNAVVHNYIRTLLLSIRDDRRSEGTRTGNVYSVINGQMSYNATVGFPAHRLYSNLSNARRRTAEARLHARSEIGVRSEDNTVSYIAGRSILSALLLEPQIRKPQVTKPPSSTTMVIKTCVQYLSRYNNPSTYNGANFIHLTADGAYNSLQENDDVAASRNSSQLPQVKLRFSQPQFITAANRMSRPHYQQSNRSRDINVEEWLKEAADIVPPVEYNATLQSGGMVKELNNPNTNTPVYHFELLIEKFADMSDGVPFGTVVASKVVIACKVLGQVDNVFQVVPHHVITSKPVNSTTPEVRWTGNPVIPASSVTKINGMISEVTEQQLYTDYKIVELIGGSNVARNLFDSGAITTLLRNTNQWTNLRRSTTYNETQDSMKANLAPTFDEALTPEFTSTTMLGVDFRHIGRLNKLETDTLLEYFEYVVIAHIYSLKGITGTEATSKALRNYIKDHVYTYLTDNIMGPSIGESAKLNIPLSDTSSLKPELKDILRVQIIDSKSLIQRAILSRFSINGVERSNSLVPAHKRSERDTINATIPMSYVLPAGTDTCRKFIFTYHPDLANALAQLPVEMKIIKKATNLQHTMAYESKIISEFTARPEPFSALSTHKILLRTVENGNMTLTECSLDPIIREVSTKCWNYTRPGREVNRAYVVWHAEYMIIVGVQRTSSATGGGIECWIVINPRASHLLVPFKDADLPEYRRNSLHQNIRMPSSASYLTVVLSKLGET